MYLLELAGQSVRGLSPAVRLALKPGYLVLKPPGNEPVALAGLLSALLFSDGRGGDSAFLAPGQKTGKAGVTLLGGDQNTYRVVRELGGTGALHRLDKVTQKFAVVTEDVVEIAQFLRSQVGVPSKTAFEQLFTLTLAQLPSRRVGKGKAAAPATSASGSKPALAQAQPVSAAGDVAAAKVRLDALNKELVLSKDIDQLQFKLDGVSSQLYELESKLSGTEGIKAALADAEAALAAAPTPESLKLPKDILSRCERYPQLLQRRDEALAKLGAEGDEAPPEEPRESAVEPLTQDMRFWAGVGGGVLFLGTGLAMHGPARYVTLLDILPFGFAALTALKHIEDLQAAQRTTRKGGMREAREKKVRESFDQEAAHVRGAMKALGVESPAEVLEQLSRKPLLAEKVEEFRHQLQQAEADPGFAQAAAKQAQLKQEQERLNQELLERGGYIRPVSEVERELERVQESIRLARAGPVAAPAAAASPSAPGPAESHEDPIPALLRLASDLFSQDVPSVGALLKDRCAQYLAALSDRRFQALEVDKDGRATAVGPGKTVSASQLPAKDLDLMYLAVRLTLVEKASAQSKIPFIVEDVFSAVDEPKLPLFARMLKHLGTATQVLHVCASPAFDSVADLVIKL